MCFAAGLCGCTVGPDYQFPEVAVPALFGSASRELVTQETAPQPEPVLWWQTLHDPVITRLVEQAIACNLDIEIALTRMQAVRTQQIVVVGTALPTVEASAGIAGGTGTDLVKGRVPQALELGHQQHWPSRCEPRCGLRHRLGTRSLGQV